MLFKSVLFIILIIIFSQTSSASQTISGSTIRASNDTEYYNNTGSYVLQSIVVPIENTTGYVNISYEQKTDVFYSCTNKIRKNGVDISSEYTSSSTSYTQRIQNISVVLNTTDTLELWGKDICYVRNFRLSYDYEYPIGYQVLSFDNLSGYGFNDSYIPARMDVSNGDVRINGSAGSTVVFSNSSYDATDIVFDFKQLDASGATGITFNGKNSTSFYHIRSNPSIGGWQIYRFGTTLLLRTIIFTNPINVPLRGRIVLSNTSNSTFYLSYMNYFWYI